MPTQIPKINKAVTLRIGETVTEKLVEEIKNAGAKVNVIYRPAKYRKL